MNGAEAQQGFTLIEVLVALTLMALVSLISWRGLDAVQQTGERLDERSEATLSLVRALGQIERDLLLHAGEDILPLPISASSDNAPHANRDKSARMPPGIAWDPQTGLSLVRSAGDGLWQQLRWYLHQGKLIRAVGAPSYLLPLPAPDTGVVVLEQIDGLSVRLWLPSRGWTDPHRIQETVQNVQGSGAHQPGVSGQEVSITGLEIALYRQDTGPDHPYRKVVVLP